MPAAVWQRGRLWLANEAGQEAKCLRYDAGVYPSPVLRPGETTSWWQHGVITNAGTYRLSGQWEGSADLRTQPVPVAITYAGSGGDVEGGRRRSLQLHMEEFSTLVPNTNLATAAFTTFVFTNNPVVIRGLLYQAFCFVMPDVPGDLLWALVFEQPSRNHIVWYIIPEKDTMQGFDTFHTESVEMDYPGIARTGDQFLVQSLAGRNLVPGKRYAIWFQCQYREVPSVTLSFNILDRGTTSGDLLSHILPEDPQKTGPRTVIQFEHNGTRRVIRYDK